MAGLDRLGGLAPDHDALSVLDVNLVGPWRVTAAALPALRESRGRVVNVASGLAFLSLPYGTAYCMSKRGLTAYSDALRIEHGDASLESAAKTLVRAAVGRPVRDLATTRRGTLSYCFLRHAPRRLVDRGVRAWLRRSGLSAALP